MRVRLIMPDGFAQAIDFARTYQICYILNLHAA